MLVTQEELIEQLSRVRGTTFVTIVARTEPKLKKKAADGTPNTLVGVVKFARVNGAIGINYEAAVNRSRIREGVEEVFEAEGWAVQHECPLGLNQKDRVDFFYDGVAIEVKVDGSTSDVTAQLQRYALHGSVREVLLITTRSRHVIPAELGGKPVTVLLLRNHAL